MVPPYVLQKLRTALLVAGAVSAGCARGKVAVEATDAFDTTEGGAAQLDARYLDASADATSLPDDGGAMDAGAVITDAALAPGALHGQAQVGSVSGAPASSDLPRLVAGMRARIRACYRKGLESDPTMAGKITVHAVFGPNGESTKVEVRTNTGVSPVVESCVAASFRQLHTNGPADITIPITFVSEQ